MPKDIKLLDAGKNLVLIDNVISENSSSENSIQSKNSNRKNTTKKLFKIKSSSSLSSDFIENKQEEIINDDKEDSSEKSTSIKNGGNRNIFDHKEIEKDLFSFDSNFFINSEINSNNQNLINIIKNLLIELNKEMKSKDEEENNKSIKIN